MRKTLGFVVFVLGITALGCQESLPRTYPALTAYQERMAAAVSAPDVLASQGFEPLDTDTDSGLPPRRPMVQDALLAEPIPTKQPTILEVLFEVPDPRNAASILNQRLEILRRDAIEQRVVDAYKKVVDGALEYLEQVRRPTTFDLSLEEAIRRAMLHNYTIRTNAYEPAIEGTRLVEAEAAFDAEFFLDFAHGRTDSAALIPTGNEQVETTQYSGGIRQLLPSGMRTQVSLDQRRSFVDNDNLPKQTNPVYNTSFTTTVTQPLLRGFGVEVNRAQIEIARANRNIAQWRFEAEVRDRLFDGEVADWGLVQSRRVAGVLAVAVAQNFATYIDLWERREHDASPVEIANSKSRWQSRFVDFLEAVRNVKDAEDALKNLLNDPDLPLSEDIEIVPTTEPVARPLTLDQFAEVRTALDERAEILQAREAIESLKIQTAVAKNQTLPQLDLNLSYQVDGVGLSGDDSFDLLRNNDYISYSVGVTFSYPIGNRAREAAQRRAVLEESQSIVQLRQVIDGVVQEVNNAVRQILVRFSQLAPSFEAVLAAERNLRSLQARASAISPNFLETELSAVESLTNSRSRLLQVVIDYNVGLVELERVKGTLLGYNNITITDTPR